jgi:hypothetical protein
VKRFLWALLLVTALLVVLAAAAPGLLYLAGLARLPELPRPGAAPALSVEQQNWLRCELRAGDGDKPTMTDPWTAALRFLQFEPGFSYGDRLSWLVARGAGNRKSQGEAQLPEAALAIWIARHWTVEQMEAAAHLVLQRARHHECPPAADEWPQAAPGQ